MRDALSDRAALIVRCSAVEEPCESGLSRSRQTSLPPACVLYMRIYDGRDRTSCFSLNFMLFVLFLEFVNVQGKLIGICLFPTPAPNVNKVAIKTRIFLLIDGVVD